MITPEDLPGVDESLARRIIVVARSIAPCIDTLEGESRLDALAILNGVVDTVGDRGSLHILSERAGTVGVSYSTVRSWFQPDDKAGLRALCGGPVHAGPIGDFPARRIYTNIWPEDEAAVLPPGVS
jgi:hypothetical protein